MPADSQHPDYAARAPQWKRCRDAVAGQDAIQAAGEAYLPRLTEQTDTEYKAYKQRAAWYGATGRTVDGMVGMVFRKSPIVTAPDAFKPFLDDVTLSGQSVDSLARQVIRDVIEVARIGVLIEHPAVQEPPSNAAQAAAANLRPYATVYAAEAILNWKVARVNNAMQPVQVVLMESVTEDVDEFETKQVAQIRELRLQNGIYIQRLYREQSSPQTTKKEWVQIGGDIVPKKAGKPLTVIPFFPFGPEALCMDVQAPPLLDLVDVNIGHYRCSADMENGAHLTGVPTPYVFGVTLNDGEKIKLGSNSAIVSASAEAKAGFLEFTGSGLATLEKLLDRKEAQMAALGARMLAPEKTGVEAAQTLQMRHNGEDSVLAGIAQLVSLGFTRMLMFMADWAGIGGEITYALNTDYVPAGLSAQQLLALMQAWQAKAISYETLYQNLQRGEIVPPGTAASDEQAKIEEEGPALGTMSDDPGGSTGMPGAGS